MKKIETEIMKALLNSVYRDKPISETIYKNAVDQINAQKKDV